MDTLFVVTHVPPVLKLPNLYRYIGVAGLTGDNLVTDLTGDSIAALNYTFCELTALYWIWKNYPQNPEDLIGLLHYRRLFYDGTSIHAFLKKPFSDLALKKVMTKCDMLVPPLMNLSPNLYMHYQCCHFLSDLDTALYIAERRDGVSLGRYKRILTNLTSAHMFNMFISSRKVMDSYCEWVFPILFEAFAKLNLFGRSPYQLRSLGFLSERLFNLWIYLNPRYNIETSSVLYLHKSGLSNANRLFKERRDCN